MVGVYVARNHRRAPIGAGLGFAVSVTATIPLGESPHGIAVDPKTNRAYVANFDEGDLPGHTVSVLASC